MVALLALVVACCISTSGAWGARPIVVVFPAGMSAGNGVDVKKDAGDGLSSAQRTIAGARAVIACLDDSGAVSAVLYNPESSMFVRALQEGKVVLANSVDPTASERVKVARAFGAVYAVAVSSQPAPDNAALLDMVLVGADAESGKTYTDRARMGAGTVGPVGGDSNALHRFSGNARFDNVLLSAANTVVQRLLGGPLNQFARSAPPPSLLPVAPPDAPIQAPVTLPPRAAPTTPTDRPTLAPGSDDSTVFAPTAHTSIPKTITLPATASVAGNRTFSAAASSGAAPDDLVRATKQQAEALLNDGNASAAIMMLRTAIDQAPLSAALRIALAQTYLSAHRGGDAAAEARRALTVLSTADAATQADLTGLIARAFAQGGNAAEARGAYEGIVAAQPTAVWARVALARMDAAEGRADEAEAQYRAALKTDPTNRDAFVGALGLRAARGEYVAVLHDLDAVSKLGSRDGGALRVAAATAVFDDGVSHIGALMARNRAAWEAGTLPRETIYTATSAQTARIVGLLSILKAVPPPVGSSDAVSHAYKRRIYAASLLAQASTALINFIQTSDADSGSESTVQLGEFQKELADVQTK